MGVIDEFVIDGLYEKLRAQEDRIEVLEDAVLDLSNNGSWDTILDLDLSEERYDELFELAQECWKSALGRKGDAK